MPKYKYRLNNKLQIFLIICVVATLIITTRFFDFRELLQILVLWVHSLGIFGPIGFIIIYNLATLLFIPGSLLTINSGCLFGLFWGSIYVLIAALIGSILAFTIGRYLSRNYICRKLEKYPKFRAINLAVAKEGWKIVLLTRLSPLFPFNLLNYAFGVTQVSIKDYILGSFGIVPGTVMYVYIGSIANNIAMINTPNQSTSSEMYIWQWVMQGVGLVATISITYYLTKIAQKALNESVSTIDNNSEETKTSHG